MENKTAKRNAEIEEKIKIKERLVEKLDWFLNLEKDKEITTGGGLQRCCLFNRNYKYTILRSGVDNYDYYVHEPDCPYSEIKIRNKDIFFSLKKVLDVLGDDPSKQLNTLLDTKTHISGPKEVISGNYPVISNLSKSSNFIHMPNLLTNNNILSYHNTETNTEENTKLEENDYIMIDNQKIDLIHLNRKQIQNISIFIPTFNEYICNKITKINVNQKILNITADIKIKKELEYKNLNQTINQHNDEPIMDLLIQNININHPSPLLLQEAIENVFRGPFKKNDVFIMDDPTQEIENILIKQKIKNKTIQDIHNIQKLLTLHAVEKQGSKEINLNYLKLFDNIRNEIGNKQFLYEIENKFRGPFKKDFLPIIHETDHREVIETFSREQMEKNTSREIEIINRLISLYKLEKIASSEFNRRSVIYEIETLKNNISDKLLILTY